MSRRILCIVLIALGLGAEARAGGGSSTARHLLAGVRAFQQGRYEDALVELRVVARAPDAPADLAFYLGPTLYKLGRHDEALAVFVRSRAPADALTEFYLGQTYYQLRLYRKARAVFARQRTRGLGPALDEAAARYVAAVDAAYRAAPAESSIDYYLAEGTERLGRDPVVAAEYLDEARQVEALGSRRHRHAEIVDGLATAWNAMSQGQAAIDLLAAERSLSAEGSWQLARAYAMVGSAERARALLEVLAKRRGPHATDAEDLLAKLAP